MNALRIKKGLSKPMECEEIFWMVKEAYYKQEYTHGTKVCNDDSTMKSNLKQSLEVNVVVWLMTLDGLPRTKSSSLKNVMEDFPSSYHNQIS